MTETAEQAKKMGFIPKEEWKGDPDKWRSEEEFVERGENILPIIKAERDKLREDMDMAMKLIKTQVSESRQAGYEQAKREYEKQIVDLKKKEVAAVNDGDVETFNAIQAEKDSLKPPQEPQAQEQVSETPIFREWKGKNEWYQTDPELNRFAEMVGATIAQRGLPEAEFLKEVEKKVKVAFPEKFTNPNRESGSGVEGGANGSPKKSRKNFSDLPDAAKQAYNRQVRLFKEKGHEFTKEQYVKAYFEG